MRVKKVMVSILSILMVATMMPTMSFGAVDVEKDPVYEEGGKLYMDKKSQLTDDGTYTIDMEAYSTGEYSILDQEKAMPLDLVLVIDQSSSLHKNKSSTGRGTGLDDMRNAVNSFANAVYEHGKANNIQHRMAIAGFASGAYEGASGEGVSIIGKKTEGWINTGVFLENGTFKNYMGNAAGLPEYTPFSGTLAPGRNYYVKSNGEYIQLENTKGKYNKVTNPAGTETGIYTYVNGEYVPAEYTEVPVTGERFVQVPYPASNDGKQYFIDAKGQKTPVNWGEPAYVPTEEVVPGNNYWIYEDSWIDGKRWDEVHYVTEQGGYWENSDYFLWIFKYTNKYDKHGTNQLRRQGIFSRPIIDVYDQLPVGLLKPGTTINEAIPKTEPVFVKEIYTENVGKWTYNGQEVTDLYKFDPDADVWTYTENGTKHVVGNQQIYVKDTEAAGGLTSNDYRNALMPVSEGADGQGIMRQVIKNAIKSLASGGATRTGVGVEMGNHIFANNPIDRSLPENEYRKRVMVVFTDGEPSCYAYDAAEAIKAVNEANDTKNVYGADVYTVGIGINTARAENLLKHMSSIYPEATYTVGEAVKKSEISRNTDYVVKHNGEYTGVNIKFSKRGKAEEFQITYSKNGAKAKQYEIDIVDPYKQESTGKYHIYPVIKTPGPESKWHTYYTTGNRVSDFDASLFRKIIERTCTIKKPVYVEGTSIFRDIMTEDFRVTDKTKVVVSYVEGTANLANPTDPVTNENIVWGKEEIQLTLDRSKGDFVVTGNKEDKNVTVKIEYHKPGTNPDYFNMDIIDVSGFDYGYYYIGYNHPGKKIKVKITGLEARPTVDGSGDAPVSTNHPDSGMWVPDENGEITKPTEPFPEQPKVTTSVTEGVFVQDYAKKMEIPIDELSLKNVAHIQGMKKIDDTYNAFDTNNPITSVDNKYGSLKTTTGTDLVYEPKTMKWDGYDNFFVFGKNSRVISLQEPHVSPNVWARVSIIPANNVYYEDTFITEESTGTVGIVYDAYGSGMWNQMGNGENTTVPKPNDNKWVHGWIPSFGDEVTDTDGTVHHGVVENIRGSMATATFTFKGEGVDIYSRTSPDSGTITAKLRSSDGKIKISQIIDTVSTSGTYYQVPTLSFDKQKDGSPLPYGEYTVSILVTAGAHQENRYNYYLDGIRVYNPVANVDKVVEEAYGEGEGHAIFADIRDHIIDNKTFNVKSNSEGVFIDQLLDESGNPIIDTVTHIVNKIKPGSFGESGKGSYEEFGPKHEVYLKPGQQISFKVDNTSGNGYQIGLKSLDGKSINVHYNDDAQADVINLTHTGDMYYDVVPNTEGIIHVMNDPSSKGKLAVTKLKITNAINTLEEASVFVKEDNMALMESANTFRTMALFALPPEENPGEDEDVPPEVKPDNPSDGSSDSSTEKPIKPDVVEPDDDKPNSDEKETGSGGQSDTGNKHITYEMYDPSKIVIINPGPVEIPEKTEEETEELKDGSISSILKNIFSGFRGWF